MKEPELVKRYVSGNVQASIFWYTPSTCSGFHYVMLRAGDGTALRKFELLTAAQMLIRASLWIHYREQTGHEPPTAIDEEPPID